MAEYHGAILGFNEAELESQIPSLYAKYINLYNGMTSANKVSAPDAALMLEDGLATEQIGEVLSEYTDILIKNSAYLFASTFESIGGEGLSANDFVKKIGDQMIGALLAKNGFEAGVGNIKIFDVGADSVGNYAHVYGRLIVDEEARLGEGGVYIGDEHALYYVDGRLNISDNGAVINGDTVIGGSLTVGDTVISQDGIQMGDYEFWHSGNSNNAEADWTMNNAYVNGDLTADGSGRFGYLSVLGGFELGADGSNPLLYSPVANQDGSYDRRLHVGGDLDISDGYGLKLQGTTVIRQSADRESVVIGADGKSLSLGSSGTDKITLESDLYVENGSYPLITKDGEATFMNGFTAGSQNRQVMWTYYFNDEDYGLVSTKRIRITSSVSGFNANSVSLRSDAYNRLMIMTLPYVHTESTLPQTENIDVVLKYRDTTSSFYFGSEWSATLDIDTGADFFAFAKPVESECFAINKEGCKTALRENLLSFNDGVYIEGVDGETDGMRFVSDYNHFSGNLSTPVFTSGFAGSGWGIRASESGWWATFDMLTVRKKLRAYEFEAQKISVVNGSLWVSNSCSGDYAEEYNG